MRIPSSMFVLVIILLIPRPAFCQSTRTGTAIQMINAGPQALLTRVGVQSWSAGGTGVAEIGLPSAPLTNPAGLKLSGLSASVEFGRREKSKWYADIDFEDQFVVPSLASIGVPIDDWNFVAGYFNQYQQHFLISIPVTTTEFPDGTGEMYKVERTYAIHSYFGSASCTVDEQLSIGMTLGYNYFKGKEEIGDVLFETRGGNVLLILGLNVQPTNGFNLGASFRFSPVMKLDIHTNMRPLLANIQPIDSGNGSPGYRVVLATSRYEATLPWIVELGTSYTIAPRVDILASAEFQKWSIVSNAYTDKLQLHFGSVLRFTPDFSLRLGVFTQSDPAENSIQVMNRTFVTAGATVNAGGIAISAGVLDSHLFGQSERNVTSTEKPLLQTYFSLGISYVLNGEETE